MRQLSFHGGRTLLQFFEDNRQFTLWCYRLLWHFQSSELYGENYINSHENRLWFETLGREFCRLIELESVCAALPYQFVSFSFIDRSFACVVRRKWTWESNQLSHSFSVVQSSVVFFFSFLVYKEFIERVFYVPANTTRQISFRLQRFVRSTSKPATAYLGENKIALFSLHLQIYVRIYMNMYVFVEIRNFGILQLLI